MRQWVVLPCVVALCVLVMLVGCENSSGSAAGSGTGSVSSTVASVSSSVSSGAPSAVSLPPITSTSASSVLPESEWGNLFATIGEDALAFGRRVQTDLPVKAYACWQGVGGGEPIWYEDPADIRSLFNALAESGIAGEATMISTDDYTSFGFEFADGSNYGFMFDSMSAQVQRGNSWEFYELDPSPALKSYADAAREYTLSRY